VQQAREPDEKAVFEAPRHAALNLCERASAPIGGRAGDANAGLRNLDDASGDADTVGRREAADRIVRL
jgi:hypothetical protein